MKTLIFSLVAALLIAGQVFSPAVASATPAPAAAVCGDTYTVKRGDYLSKIARTCGVTLYDLLVANPQIINANIIYPGQVIRITAGADIPVTGGTYVVQRGDTLFKIATRYGTTVSTLMALNPEIRYSWLIYTGQVIRLPGSGYVGGRRVTVSSTSAKAGATVTVQVYGFPANTQVDFRLGKQNTAYSVVVDGKTSSSGYATAKVTIPSTAAAGEKWVVKVITTELKNGVDLNSPVITIAQ